MLGWMADWNSLAAVFSVPILFSISPRGLENHFPVLQGVMENEIFIFHHTLEDWKMVFQSSWTVIEDRISTENIAADHSNKPNPKMQACRKLASDKERYHQQLQNFHILYIFICNAHILEQAYLYMSICLYKSIHLPHIAAYLGI